MGASESEMPARKLWRGCERMTFPIPSTTQNTFDDLGPPIKQTIASCNIWNAQVGLFPHTNDLSIAPAQQSETWEISIAAAK